jgi:transcriptional regulator with XRE-family HTH domain
MTTMNGNGQKRTPALFRVWFKQQLAVRGWNGKTAAEKIGVGEAAISKWLRRKTPPEMKGLVAIGRAFGMPTEDLIVAAGYPVTASESDADRENRRLALLSAMPRFAQIIDRVARMPPDRQDAYLSVIEAMLPADDDDVDRQSSQQ